jgi:Protein of unknwon function (DUF3310)
MTTREELVKAVEDARVSWDYSNSDAFAAHWKDYHDNVVKYVSRWKDKGGVADLEKARHYIDKLIELNKGMIT